MAVCHRAVPDLQEGSRVAVREQAAVSRTLQPVVLRVVAVRLQERIFPATPVVVQAAARAVRLAAVRVVLPATDPLRVVTLAAVRGQRSVHLASAVRRDRSASLRRPLAVPRVVVKAQMRLAEPVATVVQPVTVFSVDRAVMVARRVDRPERREVLRVAAVAAAMVVFKLAAKAAEIVAAPVAMHRATPAAASAVRVR